MILFLSKTMVAGLLMLSIALQAGGQSDCELKKQKDDLKVYTCLAEDSKIKALKAELTLENTSFEELLAFVKDIENYVNWQYNTIEARILESNDRATIFRAVIDAPWPLSKREMIMETTYQFDSVKRVLTIESRCVAYDYPEDEDLVRVPFSIARWTVSSKAGALKVDYFLRIDPGGSVPAWLVNAAMADGPYSSFIKLKEQLRQKQRP